MNEPTPQEIRLERIRRWTGPALFAAALTAYLCTLAPGAVPGDSSALIARHFHLVPFLPLAHFPWAWVAWVWAHLLPVGGLAFRLNLLGAFCGAGAVWLTYDVTQRLARLRDAGEELAATPRFQMARIFAGACAALTLAFCIPFWVVATRAHAASLDVLLLLCAVRLTLRFGQTGAMRLLPPLALLCGAGATESPTLWLWTPVFAAAVLWWLYERRQLGWRPLVRAAVFFAAGLTLYFLFAWQNWRAPAAAWYEFHNYWQALRMILGEQARMLRSSVPSMGWLILGVTTVLPAILVALPRRIGGSHEAYWGSCIMHLLLVGVGLLVLLNTRFAPWTLLRYTPLMVTPYVITALWMGYLAGYGLTLLPRSSRLDSAAGARRKRAAAWVYAAAWLGLLACCALRNAPQADGGAAAALDRYLDGAVRQLGGRDLLVSDGAFDDALIVRAHEARQPVKIINGTLSRQPVYQNYLASLFDTPRLKMLASIGLSPLLREWLAGQPAAVNRLAAFNVSDLLVGLGLKPVPEPAIYLAVARDCAPEIAGRLPRARAFWQAVAPGLVRGAARENAVREWNVLAAQCLSKTANDLGVLLEDAARPAEADEAYRAALDIRADNLSALMNRVMLARREKRADAAVLGKTLEERTQDLRGRMELWSLSARYGYVRDATAYVVRGMGWAVSGNPDVAVAEVQRADELGGGGRYNPLLAGLYAELGQTNESRRLYEDLLAANPTNKTALLGSLRLAASRGDFTVARQLAGRLAAAGFPEKVVLSEQANVELLAGDYAHAHELLLRLQHNAADDPYVLARLLLLAVQGKHPDEAQALAAKLSAMPRLPPPVRLLLAGCYADRRDYASARAEAERAVAGKPQYVAALELLLRLDVLERRRAEALTHAHRILEADSRQAYANYVLGTLQLRDGNLPLAENFFRVSIQRAPTADACNDLAWLLYVRKNYAGALEMADRALAQDELQPTILDTRGAILTELGRLDEAETDLQKALKGMPRHPEILLHLARLYEKRGLRERATELVGELMPQMTLMTAQSAEELRAMSERLHQRKP